MDDVDLDLFEEPRPFVESVRHQLKEEEDRRQKKKRANERLTSLEEATDAGRPDLNLSDHAQKCVVMDNIFKNIKIGEKGINPFTGADIKKGLGVYNKWRDRCSTIEKALSAEKDYTVRLFQIAKLQGDAKEVRLGCDEEAQAHIDEVGKRVEELIKTPLPEITEDAQDFFAKLTELVAVNAGHNCLTELPLCACMLRNPLHTKLAQFTHIEILP